MRFTKMFKVNPRQVRKRCGTTSADCKMQQSKSKLSPIIPLNAASVIIRSGGVGERLKPAVLKNENGCSLSC